jgi:hypothetical protein
MKNILKEWRRNAHESYLLQRAECVFQITEYKGELWFIYERCLLCPCSMMKGEPLEALKELRLLFIERNQ